EGFNMKNCVADLVANRGWLWPQAWLLKAPDLGLVPVPTLIDSRPDLVQWRDSNGLLSYFSIRAAWEALRPRGNEVSWYRIVWELVRQLAGMEHVPPYLHDILLELQLIENLRTTKSVFGRLIMPATSYLVWLERNNHLFKKVKRSSEELRDIIMVTVRLKLLTFRFKNTAMVHNLLSRWKMPRNFRLYI
ncbi:hypothetical protein Tco_0883018, partial [Tanacetum coccineum]